MDKLIESLVVTSPSLVGGIVVLVLMLRHMRTWTSAIHEIAQSFQDSIRSQAEHCHAVQRESIEAMRENSKALAELMATVRTLDFQRTHHIDTPK